MAKKETKKTFVVTVRCVVIKQVTCETYSKDQAMTEPFESASEEIEIDQLDYEVLGAREE